MLLESILIVLAFGGLVILSALQIAWSLASIAWFVLMAVVAMNDGNWSGWSSIGAVALGLFLLFSFYTRLPKFPIGEIKKRVRIGGSLFVVCFGAAMLLELSHVAR